MFISLASHILSSVRRNTVQPAVCSIVCNCRRQVSSIICPLVFFPPSPAYCHLISEIRTRGAAFASAFAPASMPLDGLANLIRVPLLSSQQRTLLVCLCGHARHFIHSLLPHDPHSFSYSSSSSSRPRLITLQLLYGYSTVCRMVAAGIKSKLKMSTGGSILTGPQLQPRDAAWQADMSSDSCVACKSPFSWTRHRHHCRLCKRFPQSLAFIPAFPLRLFPPSSHPS